VDESLEDRVLAIAEPEIRLCDLEFVDLELLAGGGRTTLRFLVQRQGGAGVSVGDCARVSRAIGRAIEAEDEGFIGGRYVIEVSSPGVFRPLKKPEHFERAVEEIVKLVAAQPDGSTQQLRGRLVAVEGETLEIELDGGERRRLEMSAVRKAHLDPELDFGRKRKTGG